MNVQRARAAAAVRRGIAASPAPLVRVVVQERPVSSAEQFAEVERLMETVARLERERDEALAGWSRERARADLMAVAS